MLVRELSSSRNNQGGIVAEFTEEEIKSVQDAYKDIQNGPLSPTQAMVLLTRCKAANADPVAGHIVPQIRNVQGDDNQWIKRMVLVTTIDFLRLVADRTGEYSPGADTQFGAEWPAVDKSGFPGAPVWAKSFVRKFAKNTWHEYSAQAFFREYAQLKRGGGLTTMWAKMPYGMLEKCAEAKALRRGFPNELQGLYSHEEMQQADNDVDTAEPPKFFGEVPRKAAVTGEGGQGGGQQSVPPPPAKPKDAETAIADKFGANVVAVVRNPDAVAVSLPVQPEISSGVFNPPPEEAKAVKSTPIENPVVIPPLSSPPPALPTLQPKKDIAITPAQLTRLVTIQQQCKVSDAELASFLKTVKTADYPDGLTSRRQIPKNVYEIVVGYVEGKKK
jgi:phage recombination protein Bet